MHKEIIDMLKLSLSHIRASSISIIDGKETITSLPDTQELSRIWKIIRVESQQAKEIAEEVKRYIPTIEDLCD